MTTHPALERAEALIELKRYDEAAAMLGGRLAEDPDDVRAWVKLGRCQVAAGQVEEALTTLGEALRRAPEDIGALYIYAFALRRADHLERAERWRKAEEALRQALRVDPRNSSVHALLGEFLMYNPTRRVEALALAKEAVRLDPESVDAYQALWRTAGAAGETETYTWALRQVLRLDPTDNQALYLVSSQEAHKPGTTAAQAAEVYADALAAAPDNAGLRHDLDRATYRLLRGVRWLALICVAAAGVMVDLFPEDGEAARDLPVPLGNRLWVLVVMAAVWGFGAWRRYCGLRSGVQLNVRSLVRRGRWARVVLAQAAWAMLCALLISQVPWTERSVPRILFWAGLLPTLATVWFDRRKTP
ncbi:tetratricopeptide repeat protein [Streptomyces lonegramiae]|uniref:Tetratricopeptide repeat protein n=1 Tax=Streptomyces lonegramiae TaxID=3075524 RepID=A0ABU2XGL5_9ACTN|nr:tetratricopeptide repeat protein [Streptomyces sp. DSM 41529]MDT0545089.1 tetratricopeptide repeat protein [Streptomyces sp. DSM 41529]